MDLVFAEWAGLIPGDRASGSTLSLTMPLKKSEKGGSGAFRARASDGLEYYVKAPNHAQGGKVLVSEFVVAALGNYLGPGICRVQPIEIDSTFVGWEFKDGLVLQEGWGTASGVVPYATDEGGQPLHRGEDDNANRHVTMFALYDLCWGGDGQWLFSSVDSSVHSHDHGWYFPPEGADWNPVELRARAEEARTCPWDPSGLSRLAVETVCERLLALDRTLLLSVLSQVPSSWPVEAADLEALGAFVESRTEPVATRLASLV